MNPDWMLETKGLLLVFFFRGENAIVVTVFKCLIF